MEEQMAEKPQTVEASSTNKGNKTLVLTIIIVAAALLIGSLVYFFAFPKTSPQQAGVTESEEVIVEPTISAMLEKEITEEETTMEDEAVEVQVEAFEYGFTPKTITVNEGDKVRIVLTNTGRMIHNFVVDEFGVETKTIPAGQTDTVEFVAGSAGTYEFYCSVSNHRALGMVGTLVVQ